jgi:hypothetical protein
VLAYTLGRPERTIRIIDGDQQAHRSKPIELILSDDLAEPKQEPVAQPTQEIQGTDTLQ